MAQLTEPIRVRINPREPGPQALDPRQAFWAPLRGNERFSNAGVSKLEAILCRELGPKVRDALLEQLAAGLRRLDSELFPDTLRDFERFFFHRLGPPDREWYGYQLAEALGKYFEYRQAALRETPELRGAHERLVAAARVVFATRIVGYSSLTLDLSTASFKELASAFSGNFDSFRVFLDAFIPVAFAEVFGEDFADRFDYSVVIPASTERAFNEAAQIDVAARTEVRDTVAAVPGARVRDAARERAEWLWRLANGSLLIPVVIALLVMFYGVRMLSEIQNSQYEALRPILQHQLELLKEDRQRLSGTGPQGPGPATRQTEKTTKSPETGK